MDLKDAAQIGNEKAAAAAQDLMEKLGTGHEYTIAVTAMASTLMFHTYRLGRHKGKAVEYLQAALDDVAHNVQELNGERIRILVERK